MNVPNALSLFRIVLVPVFVVLFFSVPEYSQWAAGVLVLSGITDFLDGWIARKFGMVTQLGKILDPLADKLTQLVACICLAIRHKEFIIILCLLMAKEIIMVIVGYILLRKGHKLPGSKWHGKVATIVFYLIMIYVVFAVDISSSLLAVLVGIMAAFAILAFVLYIPEFFKLRNMKLDGKKTCSEIIKDSVKPDAKQ